MEGEARLRGGRRPPTMDPPDRQAPSATRSSINPPAGQPFGVHHGFDGAVWHPRASIGPRVPQRCGTGQFRLCRGREGGDQHTVRQVQTHRPGTSTHGQYPDCQLGHSVPDSAMSEAAADPSGLAAVSVAFWTTSWPVIRCRLSSPITMADSGGVGVDFDVDQHAVEQLHASHLRPPC